MVPNGFAYHALKNSFLSQVLRMGGVCLMQLLGKELSLPMPQTHQTQSERTSSRLLIQKTTQVGTFFLNNLTGLSYDKNNDFSLFCLTLNSLHCI